MSYEYDRSDEGPEAQFAREEQRRLERLQATIDNLIYSLRPSDAHRPCFSWADICRFKLKRSH